MSPKEIDNFIINNYKTMKNSQIMKTCQIKQSTFYKSVKRLKLSKKPQLIWADSEIELLKTMWYQSEKKDILNAFPDRSYTCLKSKAMLLGCQKDKSILCHNKLCFLLSDSNTSHYWLGFLMADGHFSEKMDIKLTLSGKDLGHLKKFADLVNANIRCVKSSVYKGYKAKRAYSIAVRDVNTVKYLKEKYLIHNNKTKNPCDISTFNTKEKFLCWFVGFFDGDGCVLKKQGKIVGLRIQVHYSWISNLEFISNKLTEFLGVNSRAYIDTQGYARWVCFKNSGILIREIQKLDIPMMGRKLGAK